MAAVRLLRHIQPFADKPLRCVILQMESPYCVPRCFKGTERRDSLLIIIGHLDAPLRQKININLMPHAHRIQQSTVQIKNRAFKILYSHAVFLIPPLPSAYVQF